MTIQEINEKYSFLKPRKNYVVIKEVSEDKSGEALIRSGMTESRAYGYVVAKSPSVTDIALGDLISYNEYEGQELMKFGKVIEDQLIVLKEENILLRIE